MPFYSGAHFFITFHHDPSVLGYPTGHGSWFHWIRQGCGPFDQFDWFSVIVVFILSALCWRSLWKLTDGGDWMRGKLGLDLMGRAMLSNSLILFSVDGWDCVSSLLFDLGPNYGGGNEDNCNLLQMVPCLHCYPQYPQPYIRPLPTCASARDSWTLTGKSGSVSCGITAPFSWVLVLTRFCFCPPTMTWSCV